MLFGNSYDSEALKVLHAAFDAAWSDLEAALKTSAGEPPSPSVVAKGKSAISKNLLAAADTGERDPDRLKALALRGIIGI